MKYKLKRDLKKDLVLEILSIIVAPCRFLLYIMGNIGCSSHKIVNVGNVDIFVCYIFAVCFHFITIPCSFSIFLLLNVI